MYISNIFSCFSFSGNVFKKVQKLLQINNYVCVLQYMVRRNMMIRVFLMITVITSNGLAFNFSDMVSVSLCKKCPYSELFWSSFSRIRTEYGEIRSMSPYSVRIRENTDQNNSEYGHFSRSV